LITQKDSYKLIIILFLGILLLNVLPAQETLSFIAGRDAVAYNSDWISDKSIEIRAGEIINSPAAVEYGSRANTSWEEGLHLKLLFGKKPDRYEVFAKDFKPTNTMDVFGEDIFIDYPMDHVLPNGNSFYRQAIAVGSADNMWVPHYYRDVLAAQNRDSLLKIFPRWADIYDTDYEPPLVWHRATDFDIQNGRAMFFNSAIALGWQTDLAVKKIRKTDFGYIVECVITSSPSDIWADFSSGCIFPESKFWETYDWGDTLILLLYLDGDCLDVYTYGNNIHVGTFIRVNREFIKQYQSLIKTNTCDLTNVQWPRRADGSMDYSPPAGIDLSRTYDDFISDNIDEEIADNIDSHESAMAQDNGEKSSFPLPLLLAIIGGAAVAVGVVVVVLRKKK